MGISVKNALGDIVTVETVPAKGVANVANSLPVGIASDQFPLLATEAALQSILAKLIAAPATSAKQDNVITALGTLGTQTTAAAILAKLSADPATQTTLQAVLAKLSGDPATQTTLQGVSNTLSSIASYVDQLEGYTDGLEALIGTTNTMLGALQTIGTRGYGTPLARLAVASVSAVSGAITGTEVMLHASTRCFIQVGAAPAATVNDIPLEQGEKFHMRITTGWKVAALRDTADGFLNIVPVA